MVSPLKVTSWTSVIQQRTPCSIHKYIQKIHALRHLKVGVSEQAGERQDREKDRDGSLRPSLDLATAPADTVAWEVLGCSTGIQQSRGPEGQKQHSGLSGQCTLKLTKLTKLSDGVEMQRCGSRDLAAAITRKRAKPQRVNSLPSTLPTPTH